MRFPPSFLERLRAQVTLSEVIGKRVAVKRHGREFQALCPFHTEKTPSFTISDDKGFFHCFGCGAHGDAIGFLMRHERMTYPEAVERLARDIGLPLPELTREEEARAHAEKSQLTVIEAACRWFGEQLKSNAAARDYAARRGLTADTIATFRIGYAPEGRDGLYQHLLKNGYPERAQLEAGLIARPEEGGVYDRFRGRLIFPIRSARGDVIAFGGRLIAEAKDRPLPKYLNSPETPLFKKGETLFNLDLARRAIRERGLAAVMEGYMDVVSTAQAGVDYAVATLGTAVTPEHLKLLWRLCREPVLCLDGDNAGKRAMARAAEVALPLLQPGYSLRFAVLPSGEDPDSYVQKYGRESFENLLRAGQPLYRQVWEAMLARYAPKLALPETRAEIESACRETAAKIQDGAVRKHYEDFFKAELWEKIRKLPRANTARSAQVAHMATAENAHGAHLDALIGRMLVIVMGAPALLHKSAVEETLSHLDIRDAKWRALRDALLASLAEPIEDSQALHAWLAARLPDLPAGMPRSTDESWQLWNEAAAAHHIAVLEAELAALQLADFDEAAHRRLVDLQEAIRKAQRARSFAPMAEGAV